MVPQPQRDDDREPPYCDDEPGGCAPPPALQPPPPYPPASSSASHGRSTFVTALIIAGSALAFLVLCLFVFLLVRRRRQQRQRRRREALLEAALAHAAPAAFLDGGDGPGEDDVVHHAWHIRTVGLDEAAIESIALARHRAGAGGGAADCAVCLGEFSDGELVRLLPKCAHAFHVPCIDTWLRAHVNCPLCRADVLGPSPAAAVQLVPPSEEAGAGADEAASSTGTTEHEQPDVQANEQRELGLQVHQSDPPSSPEHQRHRDHPTTPIAPAEDGPEGEQDGSEKEGSGAAICCEASPGLGRLNRPAVKRSLSAGSRWAVVSRHCRAHSSLLPM